MESLLSCAAEEGVNHASCSISLIFKKHGFVTFTTLIMGHRVAAGIFFLTMVTAVTKHNLVLKAQNTHTKKTPSVLIV